VSLPAPGLDDRHFQDIVDEAKRRIPRLCPEWTDHNVSDPGVALIELYAWMTEMILYRLNQVPDRLYVKFLELVGIELYSAAPARTQLLFELSAPQPNPVRIPAGIQVSTERIGDEEPVVFMTDPELTITPPRLISCLTRSEDRYEDHWDELRLEAAQVRCFRSLQPGDACYLGFEQSLAGNLVRLDVITGIEGAGIDPKDPPLTWETWDGRAWRPARLLSDTSGGFNSPEGGAITLLLDPRHEPLPIGAARAYWLRCKLLKPREGQPTYSNSPELQSVAAVSAGGAVSAHHAEPAATELLGTSTGEPGQSFEVRRAPVLPRHADETLRVVLLTRDTHQDQVEQEWTEVAHFAEAGPGDRVFTWSGATGEIRFGPQIIDWEGRAKQHGAIPEADAQIYVTGYRYGGGRRGNVGAGKLTVLRTSVPFVASVRNLDPATGGVDAETVENAKIRGPMSLRSGDRAVTARDFERLTLEAAPAVARARCLPPEPGEPARVLVVPRVDIAAEYLNLSDLALTPELVSQISPFLEERRLLTMRVSLGEPFYQGVKVVAEVRGAPGVRPEAVREGAEAAIYRLVNPIIGGPDGHGWPFDFPLNVGDVYALLNGVVGVAAVERVYFFVADVRTGEVRDQASQQLHLRKDALFMSYQHRVVVRQ
jgi:predicted phage baseplate assembly protein